LSATQQPASQYSALRQDIRLLGKTLGEVIRDSDGKGIYDTIEKLRRAAVKGRREGDASQMQVVQRAVRRLGDDQVNSVARAFSYFLHLSNIAEDREQNRRQRDHELHQQTPMRGSLRAAIDVLEAQGVSRRRMMRSLDATSIVPVLTAHPTEVQRKSTLDLHREIARQLLHNDDTLAPWERRLSQQRLSGLIATLWQTRMLRQQKLTVLDEIDNALGYYEHTFLRAIPRLYHDLAALLTPGKDDDPPREEAIAAVRQCQEAGIRVKMITGDHAVTAQVIAAQLGIGHNGASLTGQQIETLSDEELRLKVREVDVFARASPEHKLRLVQALQANGEVVAMTGDGVNDAPALKRADIGVAMGQKGTEVSKEAAGMVLADDNFASIAHAVEEGRTVYDNLKKALLFLLPTNGGQALVIIIAILLGMVLPITPVQILWVNMVTAVTLGLALAFEPTEADAMRRPPRPPGTPILSGFMVWRVTFVALLLVAGTFSLFLWEESRGASPELARTVAVNTLVMCQILYLFSARYILAPACTRAGLFGSRYVLLSSAVIFALQLLFTYAPSMQALFRTEAIDLATWARILLVAIAVFTVVEMEKVVVRHATRRET